MRLRRSTITYICGLAATLGCAKAPPVPKLDRHGEDPVERIVLHAELKAGDYREIFRAVNRGGKLDGLKPYFEEPSDEKLDAIGGVLSRQLYEEALSRRGLVSILEQRIQKKTFSVWEEKAGRWKTEENFAVEKRALHSALRHEKLTELAKRDAGFLSQSWIPLARAVHTAKEEYRDTKPWEPGKSVSTAEIFSDVKQFLQSPSREELAPLLVKLKRFAFGGPLFEALYQMRESAEGTAFEGAARGMAAMLGSRDSQNKLERLMTLDITADAPTDGLFLAINEKFVKEPDFIHELAERFRPMAARSVAGFLKEILSAKKAHAEGEVYFDKAFWEAVPIRGDKNAPSAQFGELFAAIRAAIERVTGPAKPETADDAFLHNLPIYTTAFALTKWCEQVVLDNRASAAWKAAPEKDFHQAIFQLPITLKEDVEVDFLGAENPPRLTPAQELGALGLTDFAALLQQVAGTQQFGKFQYLFSKPGKQTFGEGLVSVVNRAHETRSISDTAAFVRALIFPLTRPAEGSAFTFKQFESPNLMDSLNRFLAVLPLEGWRNLKRQMFVDLKLGQLSDPTFDTRRLVLDLYPPGALKDRVATLLDHFPVIEDFDRSAQGLPSAFEAYRNILGHMPLQSMNAVTSAFSFAGRGKFLAGTEDKPQYPSLFKTFRNAEPVARTLYAFSVIGNENQEDFLRPVWKMLGNDGNGLTSHLELLDSLVEKEPEGLEALLDRLLNKGGALIEWLEALTPAESEWVTEFLGSDDFPTLVSFLRDHGGRSSALQLVRELKNLSRNGYLAEAFHLLRQINNERMRRIGAVLAESQSSGQLLPLLHSLEIFLE